MVKPLVRRLFIHIHLWKTGGTTFFNMCRRNFGKGFRRDTMMIQDWSLTAEQVRWIIDYHSWLSCYSCHMVSSDLPYEMDGVDLRAVSFVRNPIDRYISSYHYQRSIEKVGPGSRARNFVEFYHNTLGKGDDDPYGNGQTFVLGGAKTEQSLQHVTELVEQGRLLLLVTERFDESCLLLESVFSEDFKDCSYVPLNVSEKKETIGDAERKLVERHNTLDLKLHKMANEFLDRGLESYFGSKEALHKGLSEFRKRCRKKPLMNKVGAAALYLPRQVERSGKSF